MFIEECESLKIIENKMKFKLYYLAKWKQKNFLLWWRAPVIPGKRLGTIFTDKIKNVYISFASLSHFFHKSAIG